MPYVAPSFQSKGFNCPYCGAFAQQKWVGRSWLYAQAGSDFFTSTCTHCEESGVWISERLVYPDSTNAPQPNTDLPETVKKTYLEAASISSKSSSAAAALLRLAVEKLCNDLEPGAKDLNQAIGNLVSKGLPSDIQKALDIVRVTGNNAIHAGQIDVDSLEVVSQLFDW